MQLASDRRYSPLCYDDSSELIVMYLKWLVLFFQWNYTFVNDYSSRRYSWRVLQRQLPFGTEYIRLFTSPYMPCHLKCNAGHSFYAFAWIQWVQRGMNYILSVISIVTDAIYNGSTACPTTPHHPRTHITSLLYCRESSYDIIYI